MAKVLLNNQIVEETHAKVSVFDQGFLYGDGVYETLRSYDGKIFRVKEHFKRLQQSALAIGLNFKYNEEEFVDILYKTLQVNALKNAMLRISVTRGGGEIGIYPGKGDVPTIVVIPKVFPKELQEVHHKGIKAKIVNIKRNSLASLPPYIKSLNLLNNILARKEAIDSGFDEAIMLNLDGYVAESTASNIFWVKNGVVKTPRGGAGILFGVTRQVVLELAKNITIPSEEGLYLESELLDADEVFLTSTLKEVMPVIQINEKIIKGGKPGELTKILQLKLRELIKTELKLASL